MTNNEILKVNDICRVSSDKDENALVVVRSIHEKHFVGSLIHPYPEWATAADVIFYDILSYPIVIQTIMTGCFWLHQVNKLITSLPEDWESGNRGTHMQGRLDSRWEFKASEFDRLHLFVDDCTSYLLSTSS